MRGTLWIRLFAALVLLPVVVAVVVTTVALRLFREDKELYVYDLSTQSVELVARNIATRLESLTLRAELGEQPRPPVRAVRAAEPGQIPKGGAPYAVDNISSGGHALLRVTARRGDRWISFEVPPAALLDLRGHVGPTRLTMLNRRGQVLADADPARVRDRHEERAFLQRLALFEASTSRLGSKEVELGGQPTLVAYARVVPGLAVTQSMLKERAFAAARPLMTAAIVTSIIVVAGAIVIALLIGRSVVRPVRSMMRQAEAIARGELGVEVETRSSGLIGTLEQRLNEMSSALKQREEEIGRMQRKVLHSERVNTVGRMIGAIAKELSVPLETCFNLAQRSQELIAVPGELRQHQVRIAEELDRASNLLANLSRVSDPVEDGGKGVELDMAVSEVLVSAGPLLRQRGLELQTDLDATARAAVGADELRAVLLDVMLYVAEAATVDDPVEVSLVCEGGEARIGVCFSGSGWTAQHQEQLADPSQSVDGSPGSVSLAASALTLQERGGRLEIDEPGGRRRIMATLPLVS